MRVPSFPTQFTEESYKELTTTLNDLFLNLSTENFGGQIVMATLPANAMTRVSHSLRTVPKWRIILKQRGNGLITDGDFTNSFVEFRNNGSEEVQAAILLLKG